MNLQELREQLNIINDEVNPIGITVHLIKKNDDETGSHHLVAVIWNAMILYHQELHPEQFGEFNDLPYFTKHE